MVPQFDAIVIGTGFGGAVAACRLVQAGFHICVLERGRRYEKDDFPRLTAPGAGEVPDLSRLFWTAGHGLWELRDLNGIDIGQAAGYGGGSLIYANVHLRAPEHIFQSGWPVGYSRRALDGYYDLAAYMLQLAPIDDHQFPEDPPKTAVMQEVATALGRQGEFFHPPLAVHFDGPKNPQRPNGEGPRRRTQEGCQACGNCDIGCEFRAKNTLDFNYLAIAEDAWDAEANKPYADIRTLAEVVGIRPIDPNHPENGYTVAYEDRLCGAKRVEVTAKWVFLCAGAVNSTELLLKCRASGAFPNLSDALGHDYFANADALGLAYDGKRTIKPYYGPTITTSLLYRRDRDPTGAPPEWFLLQDGGYPPSLKEAFGIFRAPIWLGRNRYLEGGQGRRDFELARRLNKLLEDPDRIRRARDLLSYANIGARAMPRSTNRGWVRALSVGHARSQAGPNRHVLQFVSHTDGGLGRENEMSIPASVGDLLTGLEAYIPGQLKKIFKDFRSELGAVLAEEIDRDAQKIAAAVVEDLEPNGPFRWLVHPFLARLMRSQKLRRSATEQTKRVLKDRLRLGTLSGADLLIAFLIFLFGFEDPGENTAVFLVMGRDDKPGRLAFERGMLFAHFKDPPGHPVYSAEERLMRDYVNQLDRVPPDGRQPSGAGAQLRVNPAWSFLNRPITVHSQGGCCMANTRALGVTDAVSQVHGYEGLYVMDASIFPRSVGVNPAATIAAVAERNIEHHIRRHQGIEWHAPEWEAARTWAGQRRNILDPVGAIEAGLPPRGVREPIAEPISFEFKEAMQGFHVEAVRGLTFERAEELGRFENTSIRADIHARIRDLSKMLDDPKHEISLRGRIRVNWPRPSGGPAAAPPRSQDYDAAGWLRLLTLGRPPGTARERFMHYHLAFGTNDEYDLRGFKRLLGRDGTDAWQDTTTLFITIRKRHDASFRQRIGIMRVGIDDFFTKQLPSFTVSGTKDKERIGWAFSAFASFFFSNLEKVYLPEIDRLRRFP